MEALSLKIAVSLATFFGLGAATGSWLPAISRRPLPPSLSLPHPPLYPPRNAGPRRGLRNTPPDWT